MDTPYTYLFIRTDLPLPQQIVQSSHAALEAGHEFGEHSHLICFGMDNEQALQKAAMYLEDNDIEHRMFFEPDVNGYTAICTKPLSGNERRPMRRFKLLKERAVV